MRTSNRKINESKIKKILDDLHPRIKKGANFIMMGLDLLKNQIDNLANKLNVVRIPSTTDLNVALNNLNTAADLNQNSSNNRDEDLDDIQRTIEDTRGSIRDLKSVNNKSTTKFWRSVLLFRT